MAGALDGIRVLDLSRILAAPTCTQLLGDLGAEVWKIENPGTDGDDTRKWGPPFVHDPDGARTDLSAYFMCANRNKLSVGVDISTSEGQATIHALAAQADVVIENFKPGGLDKYGLDHASLLAAHPHLIYCSVSGYGQTGPNRAKPGYDLMAQGYGGIMSLTGEPDGRPMKVGVGIADVMCGMYATVGILAALRHRDRTGEGQHIDVALVDSQIAWLINEGVAHLTTGKERKRQGNEHATIVPYQTFETADGHVLVAVGNDSQYARFCEYLGRPDLAEDPRFSTNPARIENRGKLLKILEGLMAERDSADVLAGLEARKVPVGPVHTLGQVFTSDQVAARDMKIKMARDDVAGGAVTLIGNPLKLSKTPVTYRHPPPHFGEDTEAVLEWLKQQG
ncbi:CaiB/BaiF CoA transferase family protein [Litoreibacter arenae]|uniref:L-carnitine dehydratase/bile acid-inducible protein F n=1 Tax=Litoreibacter arenae DSM 19593 TaxID=1123360 RepID=S9QCW5_9RHOB|nr:CoA transferase [Litoreibacter arenae]EPX79276.1 L-carnitine dehydratase/bile acid-inducible protein F [Litoreibacter arenae DSM 19593]